MKLTKDDYEITTAIVAIIIAWISLYYIVTSPIDKINPIWPECENLVITNYEQAVKQGCDIELIYDNILQIKKGEESIY